MILFRVLFTLVSCGAHYYIWTRLNSVFDISNRYRIWVQTLLVLAALAGPLWLFQYYYTGRGAGYVILFLTWLGLALITTAALAIFHLIEILGRMNRYNPEKRKFLHRSMNTAAAAAAFSAGAYGIREALALPQIKTVEVRLKNWPQALSGFTIAQITDLHIGPSIRKEYVEEVVRRTNSIGADLIAITGDLVDGSVERLREHAAPLAHLQSKHGTYFVTGNHEYYSGVENWLEELSRLGFRTLRNECIVIREQDDFFNLAGVDDHKSLGKAFGHGPDLSRALENQDPSRPTILLAHQPAEFERALEKKIALQLSGHTHGGQVFPFHFVVGLVQPFVQGLHYVGDSCIYVSCGTGFWGPAIRILAPSEITKIVIRSQSELEMSSI